MCYYCVCMKLVFQNMHQDVHLNKYIALIMCSRANSFCIIVWMRATLMWYDLCIYEWVIAAAWKCSAMCWVSDCGVCMALWVCDYADCTALSEWLWKCSVMCWLYSSNSEWLWWLYGSMSEWLWWFYGSEWVIVVIVRLWVRDCGSAL